MVCHLIQTTPQSIGNVPWSVASNKQPISESEMFHGLSPHTNNPSVNQNVSWPLSPQTNNPSQKCSLVCCLKQTTPQWIRNVSWSVTSSKNTSVNQKYFMVCHLIQTTPLSESEMSHGLSSHTNNPSVNQKCFMVCCLRETTYSIHICQSPVETNMSHCKIKCIFYSLLSLNMGC